MTAMHDSGDDVVFDRIVAADFEEVDNGMHPDREALLREHPDRAVKLLAFFEALDMCEQATSPVAGSWLGPRGKSNRIPDPAIDCRARDLRASPIMSWRRSWGEAGLRWFIARSR